MWENSPILVEVVLVLGCALAWGFWELHTLSKVRQERERREAQGATSAAEDQKPLT
ncbi:MAG: hypothetical protein U1E49_16315 [Hyphomicrobiaceae bacterium]